MTGPRRVPFDETYLEASYQWLQDPELTNLAMAATPSRESQRQWYDGLIGRTDYRVWGIEVDGRPVGAMGLKHIDVVAADAEYFMYLGRPSDWGQGIGRWATEEICRVARDLGLTQVHGYIGTHNERSLKVHTHLGFQVVGLEGDRYKVVLPV